MKIDLVELSRKLEEHPEVKSCSIDGSSLEAEFTDRTLVHLAFVIFIDALASEAGEEWEGIKGLREVIQEYSGHLEVSELGAPVIIFTNDDEEGEGEEFEEEVEVDEYGEVIDEELYG